MLKLLRQYNQWILAVGGTLLLVAFLMPTAIQNCAQQSGVGGAVWATYENGGELKGTDLDNARRELLLVEFLGNPNRAQDPIAIIGADQDPAHWWLLVHEAERAGLVGGQAEGLALIAARAAAQTAAGTPISTEQAIENFRRATESTREFVLETASKWSAVMRLLALVEGVDRVSDRRLEQFVAKTLLGINGDIVVIDARSATAPIAVDAPTDERLAAHLAAFGDKPAPADIGLERFGYRLPDRVRLEWMSIPKSAVEASVQNSDELSSLALKKRFALDPAKYGADPRSATGYAAFESIVRARTVEELTKSRLDEITKFASDQLSLAQRGLKRRDLYFVLPDDWASLKPSFSELAASIAEEFGIPAPIVETSGVAPVAVSTVGELSGIGRASTSRFGTPMRLQQLVTGARELSTPEPTAPVQTGVAGPALVGENGDVYLFRIEEALPSTAETDLAAVRERVAADLTALERYRVLERDLASIKSEAASQGLRAVAERFGTSVQAVTELREANPQLLGFGFRLPSPIPGLGNEPKALAAIIDAVRVLPLTGDLSTIPVADRTFAVLSPDKLSLILVEVRELLPVTVESYSGFVANPAIVDTVRDESVALDVRTVFGFDELARRMNFKRIRGEDGAELEPAADAAAQAEAPSTGTTGTGS
ncbi:MAG: hypothetical protein GC172_14200 [Phycisphaera sp.]|nr:hypothetical protein [Phycisphaera sp.]